MGRATETALQFCQHLRYVSSQQSGHLEPLSRKDPAFDHTAGIMNQAYSVPVLQPKPIQFTLLYPPNQVFLHSVFAFRLSPFAFRLSPFAFRLPPFAFRLSPFAFRLPPSAFRLPPSAFRLPPFALSLEP